MKCPYCGADVKEKTLCIRCGKEVKTPFQEIEVEYKEFKVSEFLEIKPKNYTSAKSAAKQTIEDIEKQGRKKPFFVVIAIVVLLMAAIVSAFFLRRFLIPF